MGTGKSSIGRLIATRLGREFVDTDQLVVKKAGMEIADMFRKHGEAYFREQEAVALQSLQKRSNLVIGTGGGVVLRPENVGVLRHLGFIVWLTASEEVIYQRVSANTKRPLMQTDDPRKTIHELLEQREPLYSGAAHFSVDTSSLSHSRIADMIISAAQA
jgi:shikimate kinase